MVGDRVSVIDEFVWLVRPMLRIFWIVMMMMAVVAAVVKKKKKKPMRMLSRRPIVETTITVSIENLIS